MLDYRPASYAHPAINFPAIGFTPGDSHQQKSRPGRPGRLFVNRVKLANYFFAFFGLPAEADTLPDAIAACAAAKRATGTRYGEQDT